jgi:hypothetical protein
MSLARAFGSSAQPRPVSRHAGHQHFWDQALSRRSFVRTAAGAAGLVAGSGLLLPALARASKGSTVPNPIPRCTQIDDLGCFHFFFPAHAGEPATITDFNGFVGVIDMEGTGTGTEPPGAPPLTFQADVRFMSGEFIAKDGSHHQGSFGFI